MAIRVVSCIIGHLYLADGGLLCMSKYVRNTLFTCSIVLQSLYLHLLTVPGGPPENFTVHVISSTHILLMWRPPASEIQNGPVHLYTISVFEVETGTNYSYTLRSQPSEDPALQVESLHPYYDYVCSVAAVTIGPGPPTSSLTVRTFEDGE